MDFLRAAILGIVQGLAEFLPISSSGHLILVPALFKWPDQGLAFDVGLHLGTLLALLIYFWKDWWRMVRAGVPDFVRHQFRFQRHSRDSQFLWLIALGSVPAAISGLLFDDWIEEHLRQPWLVALALGGFTFVMLLADRRARMSRTVESIGIRDVVLPGRNGFLVPLGDEGRLKEALLALLNSEPLRRNLGRESRCLARDQYSLDGCARRYQDLFSSAAARS